MDAVAPLRIRRFRALWISSLISNLGSFLQSVAAAWLMLQLTGSAAWVGWMAAAGMLPLLFLALAAGALADLTDRTRIVLISQIVMCLTSAAMAVLVFTGSITPPRLLALGLISGIASAFNLPAWQSLVPDLVPRDMVASAVAINSAGFSTARAVGPALGGVLVAASGPAAGFALNAVSYLFVIVTIALLGPKLEPPEREVTGMQNAIALGIRYARYTPVFRRILGLAACFALTSAVVQSTLPVLTQELGAGVEVYGLLLGAMGVGAVAAWLGRERVVARLGGQSVPTTIALFGAAGIVLGLARSPGIAAAALMVAGACWVWTLATLNATTQLLAPAWIRGRALSLYVLAFQGVYPIGSILAGTVADLITAHRAVIAFSAAGMALGFIAPRFRVPALAEVQSPEFERDMSATTHIDTAEGGPVMIINTWVIDEADFDEFLEIMNEVRAVRLRTGAYRWRLYRNAEDAHRLSEVFLTVSWDEHLAQHRRMDDASAVLIRKARTFDRADGPTARHLVAIDVSEPASRPGWDQLVATHAELHRSEGSMPTEATDQPRSG